MLCVHSAYHIEVYKSIIMKMVARVLFCLKKNYFLRMCAWKNEDFYQMMEYYRILYLMQLEGRLK